MLKYGRKKRGEKRIQSRANHGLCRCSKGCTGISIEIASRDEEVCGTCNVKIPVGELCLYLHSQRGTQAGQSSWHHTACTKQWQQIAVRESRYKQTCTACNVLPEVNFYRQKVGGNANITIHDDCLKKIQALSQERMLDICTESINKSTVNISYTKMSPVQLKQHNIAEVQVKKTLASMAKNAKMNNITSEMFTEWMDNCSATTSVNEYTQQLVFNGKLNGMSIAIKVSYTDDKEAIKYYQNKFWYRVQGPKSTKRLILNKIEELAKKHLDDRVIEFYCNKAYNTSLTSGLGLLMIDNVSFVRAAAVKLKERFARMEEPHNAEAVS